MKKVILIITIILSIFSCGSGNSNKKTLTLNLTSEGSTLDTSILSDNSSGTTQAFLNEGLATIGKDGSIVPGLAKTITKSTDGLSYDIVLRDGLKWNNGKPITSDDFKFAWERALDPKSASEYAYILYPIKNAEAINEGKLPTKDLGVEILNDKHFIIHLERVTPYFESLLSFTTYTPMNRDFVTKQGDQYALEKENLLYSGPYVIKNWIHGSEIDLEKNPNYYDKDKIDVDRVVFKYIQDSSSALNAYNNGEIDVHELSAEQYDKLKNNKNLYYKSEAGILYLMFNNNSPIFKNKWIRKAFAYAINNEQIVQSVYDNVTAKAAKSFTPSDAGIKGNKEDFVKELFESGYKANEYNVDKAKEYLQKGLKELGLKKLPKLSIIANDSGSNKKAVELIQEEIRKNLGVNINVEMMTYKERLERMKTNNFDMVFAGWYADFLDPINFLDLLYIKNGNNSGKYNNPKYNKLIESIYNETDTNKRTKMMIDAEKLIAEDNPVVPLLQVRRIYIYNPKVSNLLYPTFGPRFYGKYVKIDK